VRVTSRAQYAVRAVYDLSFHRWGQAAQAKEIAGRQKIPLRFLEQILQDLRRAGLIEARRGPRGGYALARPPAAVSLADIFRAVRGAVPGSVADLFALDRAGPPNDAPNDVPSRVWADVSGRLLQVLEGTTMAEFIARAQADGFKPDVSPSTMYFI
jgi:Rrf2 family iron-sulfur cluster assembly transcriptional regulator